MDIILTNHTGPQGKRAEFHVFVKDWDMDLFSAPRREWVQVQVVGNREYVINPLKGHNNPKIIFDLIMREDEVGLIVPAGKTYEVFWDSYDLIQ